MKKVFQTIALPARVAVCCSVKKGPITECLRDNHRGGTLVYRS